MNLNLNYNFLHNKDNFCAMSDENNVLEIDNLNVYFRTDYGILKSVNGISFDIPKGKVVALVGESGCGKSVTSLSIDNLNVYFRTDYGILKSVNGISFDIPKGKVVALVGESGCGKSVTSLSIMRLLSDQNHKMVRGQIRYNTSNGSVDLLKMPLSSLQSIRGNEISMIFQEPMTSLNPIFTIGNQIEENINKDS